MNPKLPYFYIVTLILLIISCAPASQQRSETAGNNPLATDTPTNHFLITKAGDSIPTGVPIPTKGKHIAPVRVKGKLKKTSIEIKPKEVSVSTKVYPAGPPRVMQIPNNLRGTILGQDGVPLPKKVPAQGKVVPGGQPQPVPASPPVFIDWATANIQTLGLDQGLIHESVISIAEDSRGRIWLTGFPGNQLGVSCYDGQSFCNYTTEEGLLTNRIKRIFEDSRGDLWFGTQDAGVCRYNGKNFTHYTTEGGLTGKEVNDILEDRRGHIWISTEKGVSRYDPDDGPDGSFTHYTTKEGLSTNRVLSLLEDSQGHIWMGTLGVGKGVNRYDPDEGPGGSFTYYGPEEGLSDDWISDMIEDRQGHIWFATRFDLLIRYTPDEEGRGGSFAHFGPEQGLKGNEVHQLLEDRHGNIWVGTNKGGASRYNPHEGPWGTFTQLTTEEGLSDNNAWPWLEDKQGNIWMGTLAGGVSRYHPTAFTFYTTRQGLVGNSIRSMLADSKGNVWFGSWGAGATRYHPAEGERGFASFTQYSQESGFKNMYIREILEDKQGNIWLPRRFRYDGLTLYVYRIIEGGNFWPPDNHGHLWLRTQDGVGRYNFGEESGESSLFYPIGKGTIFSSSASRKFLNMLEDKEGAMWFALENSVFRYNPHEGPEGSFTYYTDKEGWSGANVLNLLEDSRGRIWFGTENGLSRYDPDEEEGGGSFIHFGPKEGIEDIEVLALQEDREGNIWIGTNSKGVIRYQAGENSIVAGRFTSFTKESGLAGNTVSRMLEDSQGNLWFGTEKGVSRYDSSTGSGQPVFRHYATEGNSSNLTYLSIVEDRRKNIWISRQKDITLLIPFPEDSALEENSDTGPYRAFTFDKTNGLKQLVMGPSVNSPLIDRFNQMWWGSNQGVTMLDLNEFESPPSSSPVISLNTIDIDRSFVDYRSLGDTAYQHSLDFGEDLAGSFDSVAAFLNYPLNLSLPHNLSHLSFHFSAIDWSGPQQLEYSYFMEGADKGWSPLNSGNKADYRNLSYGKYTFKVKAMGASQIWSEPFEYSFRIRPPWWQTWWAYIIYILAFAATLCFFFRWRTRVQRIKLIETEKLNTRLVQVDQLKDQFLANTSHELRTPLNGIIGIAEAVFDKAQEDEDRENLGMIIASGKRLSSLVNDLLDFSKVKNHDLQLSQKTIDLRTVGDIVLQACHALIGNKSVSLHNEISTDLPPVYADEDRLQQIFII